MNLTKWLLNTRIYTRNKNAIFKYFSRRIIIDASPQKFIFTQQDKKIHFSISTFIYLDNSESKSVPISIGEELPSEHRLISSIYRVDLFDMDTQLPPNTTYSKNELIQLFFEFGISRCFEVTIIPILRPVVSIIGSQKFNNLLENPKGELKEAAIKGGAGIVIFDKRDF